MSLVSSSDVSENRRDFKEFSHDSLTPKLKAPNCFKTPVATRPVKSVTSRVSLIFDKSLRTSININSICTQSAPRSNPVTKQTSENRHEYKKCPQKLKIFFSKYNLSKIGHFSVEHIKIYIIKLSWTVIYLMLQNLLQAFCENINTAEDTRGI